MIHPGQDQGQVNIAALQFLAMKRRRPINKQIPGSGIGICFCLAQTGRAWNYDEFSSSSRRCARSVSSLEILNRHGCSRTWRIWCPWLVQRLRGFGFRHTWPSLSDICSTWPRKCPATAPAADAATGWSSVSDGGHKSWGSTCHLRISGIAAVWLGFSCEWRFLSEKPQEWENQNFLEPFLAWWRLEEDTYSRHLLQQQGGNFLWHISCLPHAAATLFGFVAGNHSRICLAMGAILHMVYNPRYFYCWWDLDIVAPHDPGRQLIESVYCTIRW